MTKALWFELRISAALLVLAACGFPKPAEIGACEMASDCTSTDAPFCVAGHCVGACVRDDDCGDRIGTPLCDSTTGACVGCRAAADCPLETPVCDTSARTCRTCARDNECASGVCLEAEGRCADRSEVVFLSLNSGDDPSCTAEMPCRTFATAAAAVNDKRYVMHFLGGVYRSETGMPNPRSSQFYVDGSDTVVTVTQGVAFSSAYPGQLMILGHLTIDPAPGAAVAVSNNASVILYETTLNSTASVSNGTLDVKRSTVKDVECTTGVLHIEQSNTGAVTTTNCGLTLVGNHISAEITATGGMVTIENNTIVSQDEVQDGSVILGTVSGSRFAFNTMVNFSGRDGTAIVLGCTPSLDVSSNIFAWHSSHYLAINGCVPHHSLFDALMPSDIVGANRRADVQTMFIDLDRRDLHLAPASLARGIGQRGIIDVDIEGRPRSNPAGSDPDAGAYEAP